MGEPIMSGPLSDDAARFAALLALPGRDDWRLRHGGKVPCNLYAYTDSDPDGVPVGSMDTTWLADLVVEAVNHWLGAQHRWEWGVRQQWPGEEPEVVWRGSRGQAEDWLDGYDRHNLPESAQLVRRLVTTGPVEEVPDDA